MACSICGSTKGIVKKTIVKGMFKKPQKVLTVNCTKCGNLVYGYCKNI